MKKLFFLLSVIALQACDTNTSDEIINTECAKTNLNITDVYKNSSYPLTSNNEVEYLDWQYRINSDVLYVVKQVNSLLSQCGQTSLVTYSFKMDGKCLIPLKRTVFWDGETPPDIVFPNNQITSLKIQEYIPGQILVCKIETNTGTADNEVIETDTVWLEMN